MYGSNKMVEQKNPYNLYKPKNKSEEILFAKANKEISKSIKTKDWDKVEKVQIKYSKTGAYDTDSRDLIIKKWKKAYGKVPKGFIDYDK